ncbi:MAG TPA: hypothetical protein PKX24_05575, partial [Candidatus Cloacimonas acidaminovorans]|nr:hypothetical protein [Candidatus Cloacimonas acidaminovorans]
SSVEKTDINNGFQPGEKKRTYKTIFIGEKSSGGTTDINNGFQPGGKKKPIKLYLLGKKFRRNDRY